MTSSLVVLVGPMGAGKSTIGRMLAAKVGYGFLDTDHVIEERAGADIPWIFDVEGEAGFREREHQVLSELSSQKNVVLATGGGIVVRPDNRELLQGLENVIYLQASIDQLLSRTSKDKKRPLLQVPDPRAKITELLDERDPLYRSVAIHTVATDCHGPKGTVQKILNLL